MANLCVIMNLLMGTLKQQSNGLLYNNTVTGTLALLRKTRSSAIADKPCDAGL